MIERQRPTFLEIKGKEQKIAASFEKIQELFEKVKREFLETHTKGEEPLFTSIRSLIREGGTILQKCS